MVLRQDRAGQGTARRLADILEGKIVVVGVGNRLRGDDAAGPVLVDRLRRMPGLTCIDAGSALENHLGSIIRLRPDTVLIVDAVHLGLSPGEYELRDPGGIREQGLSTHDVSLRLCLELLARNIAGRVFLLGVQPRSLSFGHGLSGVVHRALVVLEHEISAALAARASRKQERME
jgi:hydrogenase 3 maturation protease